MRALYLLATFAPFVAARLLSPKSVQETLLDSSARREKVPGNNPAYYTREKAADQLFDVTEFIVTPSPPLSYKDRRVFFYLGGAVTRDHPGLANSTLLIRTKFLDQPEMPEYEYTNKISDFKLVTVRHDGAYGGPLVIGGNELVGDQELFHFGSDPKTSEIEIEAVAKLPDARVLFAFEAKMNVTL